MYKWVISCNKILLDIIDVNFQCVCFHKLLQTFKSDFINGFTVNNIIVVLFEYIVKHLFDMMNQIKVSNNLEFKAIAALGTSEVLHLGMYTSSRCHRSIIPCCRACTGTVSSPACIWHGSASTTRYKTCAWCIWPKLVSLVFRDAMHAETGGVSKTLGKFLYTCETPAWCGLPLCTWSYFFLEPEGFRELGVLVQPPQLHVCARQVDLQFFLH